MYKIILFVLLGTMQLGSTVAQNRYWVYFTNKNTTFNPYTYFDVKALQRRQKNNLPLCDSTDFPLNNKYIETIISCDAKICARSRWFNAVAVEANNEQIDNIRNLPFVANIDQISTHAITTQTKMDGKLSKRQKTLLNEQTASLGRNDFEQANIDGSGIRIAVFDAGFRSVNQSKAFAHLFKNKKIIKTYDFARNNDDVYAYSSHGTMVLSCITGIAGGQKIGLASGAEFLLARTEVRGERRQEEENWLQAVEWADKHGADIINSSLGYTFHRYFTENMNGKTSIVARAANLAAKKGILVVNAMGNDGQKDWKILCTPADADSVLSVGALNPNTNYKASFSSFGPTADRRQKPNVMAFGNAIVANEYHLKQVKGTSFSAALISGFAACAWQSDTSMNNMQLYKKIEQSAHLYPYYDYAHGYGMPSASYFVNKKNQTVDTTFMIRPEGKKITVLIDDKYLINSPQKAYNYIYYKIENPKGTIDKYAVIEVLKKNVLELNIESFTKCTIYVHFRVYTQKYYCKE